MANIITQEELEQLEREGAVVDVKKSPLDDLVEQLINTIKNSDSQHNRQLMELKNSVALLTTSLINQQGEMSDRQLTVVERLLDKIKQPQPVNYDIIPERSSQHHKLVLRYKLRVVTDDN